MPHETLEQRNFPIPLSHQRVAKLMRHRERAQRADRVDEQRVRAVERINVAAARNVRPARGLHCAGDLEREFVKLHLARAVGDLPLAHEPPKVAVGRDVVEAVIVHAGVRHVRGHVLHRAFVADLQKPLVAGGVVLQHGRAELKALRPLGPAARGVLALHGEHRRALGRTPVFLDGQNLLPR